MHKSSHLGSSQPHIEKHFFIVSGLPEHFNWQRLKDLVRDATNNQPGWTNVDASWHGPEGAKGYFSVKSDQDATSVYHLLANVMYARLGRPLLVHYFDISSGDPILLMCNCSVFYSSGMGHSDDKSRITSRSVLATQNFSYWQPIAPVPSVGIPIQYPSVAALTSVPQLPIYAPQVAYYPGAQTITPPSSAAMTNEHVLPVNPAYGVVRMVSGGLRISGLPSHMLGAELWKPLRLYGCLLGLDLRRGYAIARFRSMEEAKRTRESLDEVVWKGRQISGEDRDSTSVSEPVIVNGAPQRGSMQIP